MKTLRNIQISTKGMAILLAGILLSTGLFAQKTELKTLPVSFLRTTDQIVYAMLGVSEANVFIEEKVELEDWMTDLNKWAEAVELTEETEFSEDNMQLEDWMTRTDWIQEEKQMPMDDTLQMESWMMTHFEQE